MNALLLLATTLTLASCGRHIRTAEDITPGHCPAKLDFRYGAADIRIQTMSVTRTLMDRWYIKTGYDQTTGGRPRLVITEIDNRTDCYISTDMIRDIIEGVSANDGRFTVVVGNARDERELDSVMSKITNDPKYNNSSKPLAGRATAPQFLAKVRLTKATTSDRFYDFEDYRMTITLYDIETQEIIDSAWDVLSKRVKA